MTIMANGIRRNAAQLLGAFSTRLRPADRVCRRQGRGFDRGLRSTCLVKPSKVLSRHFVVASPSPHRGLPGLFGRFVERHQLPYHPPHSIQHIDA